MMAARFNEIPSLGTSQGFGRRRRYFLCTSTNRQPRRNPGGRKATGLPGATPHGSRATESKGTKSRMMRKLLGAVLGSGHGGSLCSCLASPAACERRRRQCRGRSSWPRSTASGSRTAWRRSRCTASSPACPQLDRPDGRRRRHLAQPDLAGEVSANWSKLGENVGVGSSVSSLMTGLRGQPRRTTRTSSTPPTTTSASASATTPTAACTPPRFHGAGRRRLRRRPTTRRLRPRPRSHSPKKKSAAPACRLRSHLRRRPRSPGPPPPSHRPATSGHACSTVC